MTTTVETTARSANKAAVRDEVFKNAVLAGNKAGLSNREVRLQLDMSEGTFNVRMTKLRAEVRANEPHNEKFITLKRSERSGSPSGRSPAARVSIASLVEKLNVGGESETPAVPADAEPVAEAKTEDAPAAPVEA